MKKTKKNQNNKQKDIIKKKQRKVRRVRTKL